MFKLPPRPRRGFVTKQFIPRRQFTKVILALMTTWTFVRGIVLLLLLDVKGYMITLSLMFPLPCIKDV